MKCLGHFRLLRTLLTIVLVTASLVSFTPRGTPVFATVSRNPYVWGDGNYGQLGNGTFNSSATVVPVSSLTGAIATGAGFSLALGGSPLTISTTSLPNGVVGMAYNQTLTSASGITPYTWSISVGSLPSWALLNGNTGAITSTPDAVATTDFTAMVTDSVGGTATHDLSITINPATLTITTISLPDGDVGLAYSQTMTATGGYPPYTWSIASGALPSWASLDANTGVITGMPNTAATTGFTVILTDSFGATSMPLSITINPILSITTTSLPKGSVGVAYSASLSVSGGTSPYSWSISIWSLPSWASLNYSTGAITGTPNAVGTTDFFVQVTDNVTATATQALSITVNPRGSTGGGSGSGGVDKDRSFTNFGKFIGQNGTVWDNFYPTSRDSKLRLVIPIRTVAKSKSGSFLPSISITTIKEPNAAKIPDKIIGFAYNLLPEGANFEPPITLTIKYNASLIPKVFSEKYLTIANWDEDKQAWIALDSTVNTEQDIITTKISHFSRYAIMAKMRPASFTCTQLTMPAKIEIGNSSNISVLVSNTGDLIGSYEVSLKIDNLVTQTNEVKLNGGGSKTVSFSFTPTTLGEHTVNINGLEKTFKVIEKKTTSTPATSQAPALAPTPTPKPTPEPAPTPKPTPEPAPTPKPAPALTPTPEQPTVALPVEQPTTKWGYIGCIIAAGVVVVGLLVNFFARRRRTAQ